MQERYLGDVHDFIKYAFIRHLSQETQETGFALGLNWYLTDPRLVDPPENKDGEQRFHLDKHSWMNWKPELLDSLKEFSEPNARQLRRFYDLGILPKGITYVDEFVPHPKDKRSTWHHQAIKNLALVDHVFLDPDTGLEIESMTKKSCPKYVLYDEISDYIAKGLAVTCVQFADRKCSATEKAHQVREACMKASGTNIKLPVLRGRVSPNILLISLAPDDKKAKPLARAINSFAAGAPPMASKGARRVMLID